MTRRTRQTASCTTPLRLALAAALTVVALLGSLSLPARAQTALTAAATIDVFADFARQVAGDRIQVIQLLGDGVDPHDYQMAPNDLLNINRSQLLFYNGYNLEPWLGAIVSGAAGPGLRLVQLTEGLQPIYDGNVPNPHFWMDPELSKRYVERIRDAYSTADPAGADTYQANAARYLDQLSQLDADMQSQFSQIPPQNRKLIAAHDAFPYFARHFGFELIGSVFNSEAQEPSPNELIALIRHTRESGARAVFTEPQLNPRLMQQVAREAGVSVVATYSDAFPADGSIKTYDDMMRANARNITAALQ
ncbi:MAG TPA: metal ABC transporter substrate-binding protein [Chloroflexota bacterium]|jgi:ABC-type Zn uptake system ZnuABC Zn-binding protein ZnuA